VSGVDPLWASHLRNVAIFSAMLVAVGATYIAVVVGVARLFRRHPRSAVLSIGAGVVFVVVELSAYIFASTYLRHSPPGPGGVQRPSEEYLPIARAVFLFLYAFAPLLAGYVAARTVARGPRLGAFVAAALGMVLFLVLILPIADLGNACFFGVTFALGYISC
jgi:hypothetical protein